MTQTYLYINGKRAWDMGMGMDMDMDMDVTGGRRCWAEGGGRGRGTRIRR